MRGTGPCGPCCSESGCSVWRWWATSPWMPCCAVTPGTEGRTGPLTRRPAQAAPPRTPAARCGAQPEPPRQEVPMSVALDSRLQPARRTAGLRPLLRLHGTWLGLGLVAAFLVPFVLADVLEMQRDVYYALYIAAVAALVGGWAHFTAFDLGAAIRRRLALTIGLAVVAAMFLVAVVLGEAASARPGVVTLAGAVAWRGVAYGAADGVLLSAFPIVAVFAA